MQAQTLTPVKIFGNDVRYVVPLFQRPYVWNQKDQWEPLWSDIRVVTERMLDGEAAFPAQISPHFLGAIVLDQPLTPTGFITARLVVDGQQRLTTLQLLLDAAERVVTAHGTPMDAKALRVLVRNEPEIAQNHDEVFKVWPTDRDQDAFRAAMSGDAAPPADVAAASVCQAHTFFVRSIEQWATESGAPEQASARLHALTMTLRDQLKMVVIDLEAGDNAQVIFETLNHRGVPLLAADLIKNLVFEVAQSQGRDVVTLYRRYWRELDGDYWRQRIARGRQYVPRIDIFVNYWLMMKVLREVPADQIFVEFREHVQRERPDIEELLKELANDAQVYADLNRLPAESVPGRFHYRVVAAMDSAAVTPVLLWLMRWPESSLPPVQRDRALSALESWMVRRALCRLTSKDVNRVVIDLLKELESADPATAGEVTERFFGRQRADSRLWPSDRLVRDALQDAPIFNLLLRSRLRMLLEAIEDRRRGDKSEPGLCPRNLTVEHLMPQAWREHWSAGVTNEEQATQRDRLLHSLGNLTLVNNKLNPALSNRPWTPAEAEERGLGVTGKRDELLKHSTLKMNADLVAAHPKTWDEATIRTRTAELTQVLLEIWPHPGGDVPAAALAEAERDPMPEQASEESEQPGYLITKYRPLIDWLQAQTVDELPVSFAELEDILGFPLPASARQHPPFWYWSNGPMRKALTEAGFRPTGVNLTTEKAVLVRNSDDSH